LDELSGYTPDSPPPPTSSRRWLARVLLAWKPRRNATDAQVVPAVAFASVCGGPAKGHGRRHCGLTRPRCTGRPSHSGCAAGCGSPWRRSERAAATSSPAPRCVRSSKSIAGRLCRLNRILRVRLHGKPRERGHSPAVHNEPPASCASRPRCTKVSLALGAPAVNNSSAKRSTQNLQWPGSAPETPPGRSVHLLPRRRATAAGSPGLMPASAGAGLAIAAWGWRRRARGNVGRHPLAT